MQLQSNGGNSILALTPSQAAASTEHRLRNKGKAMRNQVWSTGRPREHSERIDRIIGFHRQSFR